MLNMLVKRNAILLLATLAAAQLCLHCSLARPVQTKRAAEDHLSIPDLAYTMSSYVSGQYIKMQEDGSVVATGQEGELSAQWLFRMNGFFFQFENALYRGHYLAVAEYEGKTILLGHDISTTLTAESLQLGGSSEEEEISGSGSGAEQANSTNSTNSANSTDATSPQQDNEELVLPVHLDWSPEILHQVDNRLRLVTGDNRDCFMAFDSTGTPSENFCEIAAEDIVETVIGVTIMGF